MTRLSQGSGKRKAVRDGREEKGAAGAATPHSNMQSRPKAAHGRLIHRVEQSLMRGCHDESINITHFTSRARPTPPSPAPCAGQTLAVLRLALAIPVTRPSACVVRPQRDRLPSHFALPCGHEDCAAAFRGDRAGVRHTLWRGSGDRNDRVCVHGRPDRARVSRDLVTRSPPCPAVTRLHSSGSSVRAGNTWS